MYKYGNIKIHKNYMPKAVVRCAARTPRMRVEKKAASHTKRSGSRWRHSQRISRKSISIHAELRPGPFRPHDMMCKTPKNK